MLGTVSRGKHLLTRVEGDITVHTHLKMEGSWRISAAAGYPLRDHRIRLILANDERQAVGYLLGTTEVVRTSREDRVVGHLGPDLLGPDWDADEAVRRLSADPDRTIGEALLDQRNLAGIGTIYRAETLFLRGVSPWRQVGDVTGPARPGRAGQAAAGGEQGTRRDGHDRQHRPRRRGLGLRPGWPAHAGAAARPSSGASSAPVLEERLAVWCPHCQPWP